VIYPYDSDTNFPLQVVYSHLATRQAGNPSLTLSVKSPYRLKGYTRVVQSTEAVENGPLLHHCGPVLRSQPFRYYNVSKRNPMVGVGEA
jgi:hypothetical protein